MRILLLFILYPVFSFAAELSDFGLIFSAPSILMDLEDYQGGIGFKYFSHPYAVRGMANLSMDRDLNNPENTDWGLGAALEWHLTEQERSFGKVSPYLGGFVNFSSHISRTEVNGDNWTEESSMELGFGPLAGGEFFLAEHLSFFAEYAFTMRCLWPETKTSLNGEEDTETEDMQFSMNLGLGNSASLGICLYF